MVPVGHGLLLDRGGSIERFCLANLAVEKSGEIVSVY